jgi:TPR repeat protein
MKNIVLLATALALAGSPAVAQTYGQYGVGSAQSYGPTPHQTPDSDAKGPVSRDSVALAQDLRLKGQCEKAVPILRRLSDHESGYEMSQFDLGMCLFDLATKDATNGDALRKEGAEWVLKSANAGFAKAQAKSVTLYLDGIGVAADPVEAQKWALLYHNNGMRLGIGLPDIAPDLSKRLDTALDDTGRKEARARMRGWAPTATDAEQ